MNCHGQVIKRDPMLNVFQVFELIGNETVGRCATCPLWQQPNEEKTWCQPCSTACNCPKELIDLNGTCVEVGDINAVPNSPSLYMLSLHRRYFTSVHFRNHVQTAALKCKVRSQLSRPS